MTPLYRVDAHIHRQGLGQRVFTEEVQTDAFLTTDETLMRVHVTLNGVLIDEMSPIAL